MRVTELRRRWRAGRALSDLGAVALAGSAAVGALVAAPVPLVAALALVVVALLGRRGVLVVVAVGVLTSSLAARSWAGLVPPEPHALDATVTLVGDPEPSFGGWRVEVRTGGRRYEAIAYGGAGGRLSRRSWGDRLVVRGRVEPLEVDDWQASRHVAARLVVERVVSVDDPVLVAPLVNAPRALLARGASSIPPDLRALFLGFVLGDDRGGSAAIEDDFEAAGLTHLLVVSGQNVAFVLVVAGPALRRLGLRGRVAATVAVLVLFAAVTRFEPSVLRATTMAGLAAVGVALGRPGSSIRLLALAVAGLLVVDPLLVLSVGFRLSVAASVGIVVLAGPLTEALPLPRVVAAPLAVTLAAQVAVAPVLVPLFGPLPAVAVPANLLAEPVAGLVMTWGCSAGLVAGVVPAPLAVVLHVPTRLGLWWVAGVARVAADVPLGGVGLAGAVVVGVGLVGAVAARRRGRGALVAAALVVAVVPFATALPVFGRPAVPLESAIGGATLWHTGGPGGVDVLVVPGTARADGVLSGLREREVGELDLLVVQSAGSRAAAVAAAVRSRTRVDVVWAPVGSGVPEAVVPAVGSVAAGGLTVDVGGVDPRIEVEITEDEAAGATERDGDGERGNDDEEG